MTLEVFKTALFFSGYDEGNQYIVDTIWYENAWWLVATWLVPNGAGDKIPDKLVRLIVTGKQSRLEHF